MLQNHLTNLIATLIDGIQRSHWLLENHRNTLAAHLGHLAFAEVLDFFAFDLDAVGLDAAQLFV